MSTLHLLLKLQRLFSVNIEDETSLIHACSTGQLQPRNAVSGLLLNAEFFIVNLVVLSPTRSTGPPQKVFTVMWLT